MNQSIRFLAVSFVFLLGLQNAQANDPKIEFCDTCVSSSDFAWAAERAANTQFPPLSAPDTQYIYVIHPVSEAIHYFQVSRSFDGPGIGIGDGFWTTRTVLAVAPAQELAEAQIGIAAAKDFLTQTIQVDISELNTSPFVFDSALDLLGPQGPGRQRILQNAVADYWADSWQDQVRNQIMAFASRIANQFMGEKVTSVTTTVYFPDGTQIKLLQVYASGDNDGRIEFEYEAIPESIRGPNLTGPPMSLDEFLDFFGNGIDGNEQFINNLLSLFDALGGVPVGPPPGGGSSSCYTMTCYDAGVDENGNDVYRCVSQPKAGLTGC